MRWWKAVGLASVVGIAATGVVIARAERRRRAYTPNEIRAKLHARLTETQTGGTDEGSSDAPSADNG